MQRWNSELGRWLSVDPLADMYPGWSPYNYTLNNPLIFIDPNGMSVWDLEGEGDRVHRRSRNNYLLYGESQDDNSGGDDEKKNSDGDVSKEGKLSTHSSGTWTEDTKLTLQLGQLVEIKVKNDGKIKSGMVARGFIQAEMVRQAFFIPVSLLISSGKDQIVLIYNSETKQAEKIKVLPGQFLNKTEIRILRGLKEKDLIISSGARSILSEMQRESPTTLHLPAGSQTASPKSVD